MIPQFDDIFIGNFSAIKSEAGRCFLAARHLARPRGRKPDPHLRSFVW